MTDEETELQYGVTKFTEEDGTEKVILAFGTTTAGFTREQACTLGRMLINEAGYTCRIGLA